MLGKINQFIDDVPEEIKLLGSTYLNMCSSISGPYNIIEFGYKQTSV